jgi:hypothetical protein
VACLERAWHAYAELTERLTPVTRRILSDLWRLPDRQNAAFGRSVAREAEKKAIETARYVIPIACHTAMVYTVSGIVLHRLRRMARVGDVPLEALDVVNRMVAEVERHDPSFFGSVGEEPLSPEQVVEWAAAPPGVGDAAAAEAFDKSLSGLTSRLVDWSPRAPEMVARAVRNVLGRPDLDDDEALGLVLDPAHNHYRLETLNVSTHAPLSRTLAHAHYVFRKKLSHTADSQDQRHRTVPGSRPLLSRTVPAGVDVVEPELIRADPDCHALFQEVVEEQWDVRRRLLDLSWRCTCFPTRRRSVSRSRVRCWTCCTSGPCAPVSTPSARSGRRRWTRSSSCAACTPSSPGTSDPRAASATGWRDRAARRAPTSAASRCGGASPTSPG